MIFTRVFHNPFTKISFVVTSDEEELPKLRARIVNEVPGADPDWVDESKFVHQDGLDYPSHVGSPPKIKLDQLK
jgi:hypothetical protein